MDRKKTENKILPVNLRNSKLFVISKEIIAKDIELNRFGINSRPSDFDTPAPAYRYALLADDRIIPDFGKTGVNSL